MKQRNVGQRMGLLVVVAMLAACAAPQGRQAAGAADAAQAVSAEVSVVRQGVGEGLYELAHSTRQNAVFVASAGRFGAEGASRVLRLSPQTLATEAEITLPHRGFGLVLDDASDRLYIGHSADAAVTVIDTRDNRVIGTIRLAEKQTTPDGKLRYPHNFRELVVDRDHGRLYLVGFSRESSALYVVKTDTLSLERVVPGFGPLATGITLDAQGGRLFVSNLVGQLFEVNTRTLAIVNQWASGSDQPLNLAYDARRQLVYAVDQGLPQLRATRQKLDPSYQPRASHDDVVVFDPAQGRAVANLPSGAGPVSLLVDEQRDRLFVTNRGASTVTVFDLASGRKLHTVTLEKFPNSLALDRRTGVVYVSVKQSAPRGEVNVEDVARIQLP